jgi:GNAT superfamily N-acetyltransferase
VQQVAVHRSARRQGIASALIATLQTQMPGRALRFINICDSDPAFRKWMSHLGAQEMIGQYELKMML